MTFLTSLRRALPTALPGSRRQGPATEAEVDVDQVEAAPARPARTGLRRRGVQVTVGATVLALGAGSLAVAAAHKTVTLDVDGEVVEVSTFAGSVDGLLEENGIELGEHDVVAPDAATSLADGTEVVVRHGRQVTVLSEGVETVVWTTALDADEALATLAARGDDVRLVASRSGGTRAALPITLGDGPVDVRVDGATHATSGADTLDELFGSLDLTLGALDRVHAERSDDGRLTVVVQRVVQREEAVTSAIAFETSVEQTADLYEGTTRTVQAGVPGELAVMYRVVLVDGVEESREEIDRLVTREPVHALLREGTRPRPAAAPSGSVSIGDDVWNALAQCESGGNPRAVSSNGKYYGLFQFSLPTWQAMGGSGLPSDASPEEQLQRAQALQARSGWGQWPACARMLGLI